MPKKLIPIAIIIVGVLIAGAVVYTNYTKCPEGASTKIQILSPQEAGEKAIDFINQNILRGRATASLIEILEENGLYKVKFSIGEQEVESYVTLDGKFLFPEESAVNLEPPKPKEISKKEVPEVNLFVMAFCPYGNQAEELMIPVVNLLGNKANIQLHYIVSKSSEEKYNSLHGEQEVHQDIRELCVNKYQSEKLWDFVMKINENCDAQNVDSKWEEIAAGIGIDVNKIKDCQEKEGSGLLDREVELIGTEYLVQDPANHQNQEKISISGSPTLVINGIIYDGERSSEGYKEAICSGFENPPEECSKKLGSTSNSKNMVCE